MPRTYIASDRRSQAVMVTIFPGNPAVRYQPNTYEMGIHLYRGEAARWFRYWRRCGWKIQRII